ncbi:MAG: hypothetical protein K2M15_03370 [Oscillospiraceae bacterium]|nr:hypothetical protein [Oscillospiraceae bacterium]
MQSYLEASLAFLESEEMRNYLREELPKFPWVAQYCAKIVVYAPAPIEQKLPVLEQIIQEAGPELAFDGEPFTVCAARFAHSCRTALKERHSGPEGVMFRLLTSSCDEDKSCPFDQAFFTEFDAALRYLEQLETECPEDYTFEGLSYTITKYVPSNKGELKEYCTWYLNNARELWYFEYVYDNYPDDWEDLLDYGGDSLNLPVPFQPGDIIVADCLPYAAPRRILILEVGDNRDCCCLQALSINKDSYLSTGAIKHNSFLSPSENSHISALYRARRWTGELSAEEEPFAVLSPLIHARSEFGSEIWDYFYRLCPDTRDSLTWQEMKDGLGL